MDQALRDDFQKLLNNAHSLPLYQVQKVLKSLVTRSGRSDWNIVLRQGGPELKGLSVQNRNPNRALAEAAIYATARALGIDLEGDPAGNTYSVVQVAGAQALRTPPPRRKPSEAIVSVLNTIELETAKKEARPANEWFQWLYSRLGTGLGITREESARLSMDNYSEPGWSVVVPSEWEQSEQIERLRGLGESLAGTHVVSAAGQKTADFLRKHYVSRMTVAEYEQRQMASAMLKEQLKALIRKTDQIDTELEFVQQSIDHAQRRGAEIVITGSQVQLRLSTGEQAPSSLVDPAANKGLGIIRQMAKSGSVFDSLGFDITVEKASISHSPARIVLKGTLIDRRLEKGAINGITNQAFASGDKVSVEL